MNLNKSFFTHFIAVILTALSFVLPKEYSSLFLFAGLFALSGALTNHLAIHMLFEKVPFLYGSGVIPARFEAFKDSIKNLMMNEFFTKEQLDVLRNPDKYLGTAEKKTQEVCTLWKRDLKI